MLIEDLVYLLCSLTSHFFKKLSQQIFKHKTNNIGLTVKIASYNKTNNKISKVFFEN